MIPLPWLTAIPWRLVGWVGLVAVVAFAGWRVTTWREAYQRLETVEAELQAERACEPRTACQQRAEEAAATARREAEEAAQTALGKAQKAEVQARADADAWQRRFRNQQATNPDCRAWAEMPIPCALD